MTFYGTSKASWDKFHAWEADLEKVKKATAEVVASQTHQRQAMIEARRNGASLRAIADAAGVSHEQVRRTISQDQA